MEALQLKIGDTPSLRFYYPGKNGENDKKSVTIKGAAFQYMGLSAVCSLDYLKDLLKDGMIVNAAYIKLDNSRYAEQTMEKLSTMNAISTIQSGTEAQANFRKIVEPMNTIVVIMIIGAGILAFAIIYNISNINIFERRREMATLSVLGFTNDELKSVVFNENYIVTVLGIAAGMPLGKFLLQAFLKLQETDYIQMPAVLGNGSYVIAALMVSAFAIIANRLLVKKITAIDMVEALKSAE
jgi:putative ABC transport system permease protein